MSVPRVKDWPAPLPEKIKEARKEAGLTQEEAAELVYSARRTWQDWEHGVSPMPAGLWELFTIKIDWYRKGTE